MRSAARFAALLLTVASASAQMDLQWNLRIPMRDGVRLAANLFRPSSNGRFPVLLVRTPYGKGLELTANYRAFVEHGFALVIQDVRGRHDSEGSFRPLDQEGPDGEDTLNWIGHQSWCDGKIGMFGGSYLGIAQWQAALRNSPYLKAIFPVVSGYDDYFDRFYSRGGAMKLGHRLLWISENLSPPGFVRPGLNQFMYYLPLRTADRAVSGETVDWYQASLNHPNYDDFWRSFSTRDKLDRIHVPVFIAGGWFDNYAESDLEAFAALRKLGRSVRILVGPWPHNFSDRLSVDFGPNARNPVRRFQFQWFDYYLKGQGSIDHIPPAQLFLMGDNRWEDEDDWPPRDSRIRPLYLAGKGKAATVYGDGQLQWMPQRRKTADTYLYDPGKPVPTRGGAICCNVRLLPPGPIDQRAIEGRHDILVFTSPPLNEDLHVAGVVHVLLHVSTDAKDTDFTAKLIDVDPQGPALGVTDGILRLRYRNGLDRPELAKPGEIYAITIDAGPTNWAFRQGHRIRLEVASSNFPRFDRNLNTGRANAGETQLRKANQTVWHGGKYGSAILLPVAARSGTSAADSRSPVTGLPKSHP
ncbi:MAG: CocE/NonD family hydrolase [Acidobacteria bacterium]|nr:CocE/NonD family hydrolase [Acidobacteriota bacterium]